MAEGVQSPPGMVKARYHRSTGLRPPALRMSSSTPLSLTPRCPPGQRRGGPWLGLGQGVKRLSRSVVRRRGQLMDLAIDGGHIADRGGASRVSGIVAQPQGMGALAVESRALVTVVRRKLGGPYLDRAPDSLRAATSTRSVSGTGGGGRIVPKSSRTST